MWVRVAAVTRSARRLRLGGGDGALPRFRCRPRLERGEHAVVRRAMRRASRALARDVRAAGVPRCARACTARGRFRGVPVLLAFRAGRARARRRSGRPALGLLPAQSMASSASARDARDETTACDDRRRARAPARRRSAGRDCPGRPERRRSRPATARAGSGKSVLVGSRRRPRGPPPAAVTEPLVQPGTGPQRRQNSQHCRPKA